MSGKGFKKVHPQLTAYEEHRKAALAAAAGAASLKNLWPAGTEYTLAIFLSDTADPVTDFSCLDATADAPKAELPVERTRRSWWQFAKESVSSDANVMSLFGMRPAVEYENVTWDGLGAALAQMPSGQEHNAAASSANLGTLPDPAPVRAHSAAALWVERGLRYEYSAANFRQQRFNVTLPARIRSDPNATVFAHLYFTAGSAHPDAVSPRYSPVASFHVVHPLVKHSRRKPQKARRRLLGGDDDAAESAAGKVAAFGIGAKSDADAEAAPAVPGPATQDSSADVAYWKPTLHVQLVADWARYPPRGLPPHISPAVMAVPAAEGYYPLVHVNEFFLLGEELVPLNDSVASVPLTVSVSAQHALAWTLQQQMATSMQAQAVMGSAREDDGDLMKSMLVQTNPLLLALTMMVSTLHMVFDMLAFKNDISFWRGAKSMEGLSLRSIILNVFFQAVIFLYLLDNDTSWMVLLSTGGGLAIEVWKLRKAFSVAVAWRGWLPVVTWGERGAAEDGGYTLSRTREYDATAMSHMMYVLYPLIAGYAAYSLFYDQHRGYRGWLLSSLVGAVYTFGFVQMVPQLYINWKLKSVAHMPWKAMTYKALNTFVDDFFAFVIKMPWLHRIACLRDDIIFIGYLYQRWIYRVDPKRRNEFGTSAEDVAHMEARKQGLQRVAARGKFERREAPSALPAGAAR